MDSIDPFVFLEQYRLVVCKKCEFAVVADELLPHLRLRHEVGSDMLKSLSLPLSPRSSLLSPRSSPPSPRSIPLSPRSSPLSPPSSPLSPPSNYSQSVQRIRVYSENTSGVSKPAIFRSLFNGCLRLHAVLVYVLPLAIRLRHAGIRTSHPAPPSCSPSFHLDPFSNYLERMASLWFVCIRSAPVHLTLESFSSLACIRLQIDSHLEAESSLVSYIECITVVAALCLWPIPGVL